MPKPKWVLLLVDLQNGWQLEVNRDRDTFIRKGKMVKDIHGSSASALLDRGYIELDVEKTDMLHRVYKLTRRGKNA